MNVFAATNTSIVFGGAGFIGTQLLKQLSADIPSHRLISVDIRDPREKVPGVEYRRHDVREPIPFDDIDLPDIYNLAAVHTTPGHEDWEYFWTNVLGATNVCDFATRTGCRFLLFTSSISVYGPTETPLSEDSPKEPNSAYGRSKFQAEGIHRTWFANGADRRLVVVRPAVIFGPGEGGNFTRLARLLARGRFVYPGRKDTIKACGYVGELTRSMLFARNLDSPEFTYNFAYPERTTTESICAAFSDVAGFDIPKLVLPLPAMLSVGLSFELLNTIGIKTSINRARMRKLVHSTNILPTALTNAGYTFETDLPEALRRWKSESDATFV